MSKVSGNDFRAQLLVDFPEGYALSPKRKGDYLSYSETLRFCIATARKSIRLGVPFVDIFGLDFLIKAVESNTNGPDVELVARRISKDLMRRTEKAGIRLYLLDEEEHHWGFHAKYAIFDDEVVIIGSQNLIERNLKRSLEAALLARGDIAKRMLLVHKYLISVSESIDNPASQRSIHS